MARQTSKSTSINTNQKSRFFQLICFRLHKQKAGDECTYIFIISNWIINPTIHFQIEKNIYNIRMENALVDWIVIERHLILIYRNDMMKYCPYIGAVFRKWSGVTKYVELVWNINYPNHCRNVYHAISGTHSFLNCHPKLFNLSRVSM